MNLKIDWTVITVYHLPCSGGGASYVLDDKFNKKTVFLRKFMFSLSNLFTNKPNKLIWCSFGRKLFLKVWHKKKSFKKKNFYFPLKSFKSVKN
jgi:hypothetical protein